MVSKDEPTIFITLPSHHCAPEPASKHFSDYDVINMGFGSVLNKSCNVLLLLHPYVHNIPHEMLTNTAVLVIVDTCEAQLMGLASFNDLLR